MGASTPVSTTTTTVEIGTLIIDLIDPDSMRIVWRSRTTDSLKADMDKRDAQLRSALRKTFHKFPPKPKKK